jgi:hypothetical protein
MSLIGLNNSGVGTDLNDGAADNWTDSLISVPINRVLATDTNQKIVGITKAISVIPNSLVLRDAFGAVDLGQIDASTIKIGTTQENLFIDENTIRFQNTAYEGSTSLTLLAEGIIGVTGKLKSLVVPTENDDLVNKLYVDGLTNQAITSTETNPQSIISNLNIGSTVSIDVAADVMTLEKTVTTSGDILPNNDGNYAIFTCSTNPGQLLSDPQTFVDLNDFFTQYIAYVQSCGDFTNVNMFINGSGFTEFTFTVGVTDPIAFGLSPSLAVILGFDLEPPSTQTYPPGIGEFYVQVLGPLFQYTYLPGEIVTITSTYQANLGTISVRNLNIDGNSISSTSSIDITAAVTKITGGFEVDSTTTTLIKSTTSVNIDTPLVNVKGLQAADDVGIFGKLSVGFLQNVFATGKNFEVLNPITQISELSFDITDNTTRIRKLNNVPGNCIYVSEPGGDLSFIPPARDKCSILTSKNGYEWLTPYSAQVVSNPYIASPTGTNLNPVTTLTPGTFGHLRVMSNDANIDTEFGPPSSTSFLRINIPDSDTRITYQGDPGYKFRINWSLSAVGANNQTCDFALFINEVLYEKSLHRMIYSANSEFEVMSQEVAVGLNTNDVISVRCNSTATTLTMYNYNMTISVIC